MTSTTFRYIGTTDECVQCQKCGRVDLRSTVVLAILDADGNPDEITYYGSTCAARALAVKGGGAAVRKAAEGARLKTLMAAHDARRTLRRYNLPETGGMPEGDDFPVLMAYAKDNPGAARAALSVSDIRRYVLDMVTRKQTAIREAVLVAGDNWGNDRQPLDYGYGSVIAATRS